MKLYGFFQSSAAYRVRIALNLQGIDAGHVFNARRLDCPLDDYPNIVRIDGAPENQQDAE